MSQSALTSPLHALVPLRMLRRASSRVGASEITTSSRPADGGKLVRVDAHRALDTDMIRAQSHIFLALR